MRYVLVLTALVGCSGAAEPPARVASEPSAGSSEALVASSEARGASSEAPADPEEDPAEKAKTTSAPSGPLTQDRIRDVVRAHYDAMTACYVAGLRRDPKLGGTIDVHIAIDDSGEVVGASAPKGTAKKGDERLLDPEVVGCVERAFMKLTFPPTGRGMMTFTYPVVFHVE